MRIRDKLFDWWDQFECALSLIMLLFVFVTLLVCVVGFPIVTGYILAVGTTSDKIFAVVMFIGVLVVWKRLSRIKC